METRRPTHLFMVRPQLRDIPPPALPEGFLLRTWRPGDEAQWLEVIEAGYGGGWDAGTFDRCIRSDPAFRPEALFVVEQGGRLVGVAGAFQKLIHGDRTGYLHMMAVLPEFRRRGLGTALLRKCLIYFREQGWRDAALDTEGSRAEAIRLYLAHGFEPAPEIEPDVRHWRAILAALGRPDLVTRVACRPSYS